MPTIQEQTIKRQTLNLRIRADERDLIERAARIRGQDRNAFILDASRQAAEEALLDQALLRVDSDAFAAFQARLDAPPHPNERLRKTMQSALPWAD